MSPPDRLLQAIAQTLSIPRSSILLFDSFPDLGGDASSAELLRLACRRRGIDVRLDDILACPTIAELQTRVTPFPPRLPIDSINSAVSSEDSNPSPDVFSPVPQKEQQQQQHRKWADSVSSYGSVSTSDSSSVVARPRGKLESLLRSSPRVGNVCLVMPKAGPFDEQLVALVKIMTPLSKEEDAEEIALPSRFEIELLKREIRSLRMAVQEWGADSRRPQIWIPLTCIPVTKHGEPDARRLQTWVQNISEANYEEAMKLQIPEPRRRRRPSPHKRMQSRRSLLKTDDEIDCDDMECFPLSAMQQVYIQAMKTGVSGQEHRYTQGVTLKIKNGAKPSDVESAVEALVARHDMLRVRFRPVHDEWVQVIVPPGKTSYRFTRHSDADEEERGVLMDEADVAIDATSGPVFAAEHIQNENEQMVYLTAHHLAVDTTSWRILVSDLDDLLQEGTLPEASLPFIHWIDYQCYEMTERLFEPALPFQVLSADLSYWGITQDANTHANTTDSSFYLTPDQSSTLQRCSSEVLRTDPSDVLLAALLLSFCQVFPDRCLPTLWKQEDGRSTDGDLSIAETVGWFASLCPVGVHVDFTTDLIQTIKLIKDTRRATPRDGVPFFNSEFSASIDASSSITLEIILKCANSPSHFRKPNGVLDPVTLKTNSPGPQVGRIALFEITAAFDPSSGSTISFAYNTSSLYQDKIQSWMHTFETHVLDAITRLSSHEPELTLSDAPLLRSSYKALARLTSDRLAGARIPSVRDMETIYPVTPSQQEILIAQGLTEGTFHVHTVYELGGSVDTARLCEAWEAIVAATPSLRSIFIDGVSRDGLFDQVVLKKISPSMLFIESKDPDQAVSSLPALTMSSTEPRHRLSVCHSKDKTLVRLDASQAICDLTSLHLLISQLTTVYSGSVPSHNHALHSTYLYHVSSIDTSYSLEVWKTGLSSSRPCLFPRLSVFARDIFQTQVFDLAVTRPQLVSFCEEHGVEASAVMQLAWALVLRAFVDVEHVTFGYQFSGRDEELLCGIGQAVGSFASVLPCWVEVPSHQSLKDCLVAVGESFANARKHENLTLAEIQHALGLQDKDLFNTCLFFQDSDPFSGLDSNELAPSLVTSGRRTDCDVSLTAMFVNSHLHLNLSSRYLSHAQIRSIISTFESALRQILSHPDTSVSEAELFTDRDYAQLVVRDWESTTTHPSQKISACLHDIILQHAHSRPDEPAISSWDGDVSYVQLAALVTRLRTYLVNLGVGPGMAVPVVLDKSRFAPVALLAVMQAGAAFVALDSQDQVTVKSTIDHLRPHVVLATESAWREIGTTVLNLVIVNSSLFSMLPPHMSSLAREATPDHAACVFVSPKRSRSIFFTHSSLCSAFVNQGPALKMNSHSRVLQLSAFNVDVSLVEILGTMVHGGCVCIPSPRDRIHDLSGAMARMGVTWSYMTGILARRIHPSLVPSLQTLCFRTRKLDPDTYAPWLHNRNILLAYGAPDVCPLGISVTQISGDNSDLSVIPPPVTGRFWILNSEDPKKLVPMGAIGELAIDSPIVTPHRFALDRPLIAPTTHHLPGEKPKPRFLKTGHRVRYLDDGNIQFISSVRDEVVVNGRAVDVSEVERHIRRCLGQGVDVVVDTISTRDSPALLAAFLELGPSLFHGQEGLADVSLRVRERTYIAKKMFEAWVENPDPHSPRLPAHCVPSVFIPLKELPLSTSLKVNRRKLQRWVSNLSYGDLVSMSSVPNPAEIQRIALSQKPLPLTRPEEAMRSVWARVLHIPPSAIRGSSSFFSVGGNKFLATELVIACRKVGLRIPLVDILKEATLTEICRAASSSEKPNKKVQDSTAKSSHIAFSMAAFDRKLAKDVIAPQLQCPVQDVLDLTEASAQQIQSLELGMFQTRADIVCLVLSFNGPMDVSRLEEACRSLTKMHTVLRTGFVSHEHRLFQVLCGAFKAPFRIFPCESDKLDSATEKLVKQEQGLPFDLKLPVTQFTFLNAEQHGTLIIRLSKAQIDEASTQLLVQDLASLYEGSGQSARSSFFDYTRAARSNREQGFDFWRTQLEDVKMTKVISHTKPVPPAAASEIKSIRETASLGSLAEHAMSHDTALKAAWAIVLATISGAHDVLFGEVIQAHNVNLPETVNLGNMVGPLTNIIPVRVQFPSAHSTPLDLMACIQRQRQANARFDMLGIQELIHRCTRWRPCTQFSTVVHHEAKSPLDGSSTLNIAGATFTYKAVEPTAQAVPDILVRSTVEGTERVTLEIRYSEERIQSSFAESCLRLLVAAWETIAHPDTICQPMVQSAQEISRVTKQIPFPPEETDTLRVPLDALLQPAQRKELEVAIVAAWDQVIKPSSSDIPKEEMLTTPFYAISKSLLAAHQLTSHLNHALEPLGIDSITLKTEDVLAHPSMQAQLELIARLLRIAGTLSLPVRPKSSKSHRGPKQETTSSWRPKSRSGPTTERPLTWRNSFLSLRPKSSMRDLGLKVGWKKNKNSNGEAGRLSTPTSEQSSSMRESTTLEIPPLPELPPHAKDLIPELSATETSIRSNPVAELQGTVVVCNETADRSSSGGSSWRSFEEVEVSPIMPFEAPSNIAPAQDSFAKL
ncbi:hypothetical protein ACJ41O_005586 [Fusarium nematophilum]